MGSCDGKDTTGDDRRTQPFSGIEPGAIIEVEGADPVWRGRLDRDSLMLTLNGNETSATVERFAGNNGLGFTGRMGDGALVLTITPGTCRVRSGDAVEPYTATLQTGDETRFGCARTVP